MLELAFVRSDKQNLFWVDIADALREELEALGVRTSVHANGFPPPRPGLVYLVAPPHEYFVLEGHRHPPERELLRRSLLVCGEQPGTLHFEHNVQLGREAAATFDINRASVRVLQRRGLGARHLQLGHTARWDAYDATAGRDVDLVFLGCESPRRAKALSSYAPTLWRYRSHVLLSDNSAPNRRQSARFAAPRRRADLLSRSRLILNVHQQAEVYFEWHRVVTAMLAGCAVVSEHASDFAPLEPGTHFLPGRWETLGLLAQRLLEDEDRRREMAAAAYGLLRDEIPLSRAAVTIAEVAVEVDRAASGSVLPLSEAREAVAMHPFEVPDEDDIFQPPRVFDADGTALRRAVKDVRLEMLENRRMLARWRLEQAAGRTLPELEVVAETPAWAGAERRVTVLTPNYNHGHHVGGALATVAEGRYPDIEFVVVDDGSSDDSLAEIGRFMARRPELPVLLLRHPVNRGLPHARNSGLGLARGEFVLPLDADNELFPIAVERLVTALDDHPEASFAYGILEAFTHDGPSHLASQFPWEPARLRRGNYIDALSLLRTDRIRAHGGYLTDRRLHGWEDYALWCSFAERGEHAAFVPEIVARYRVTLHSMLALTNIAVTDALSVLAERYPTVMRGIRIPA